MNLNIFYTLYFKWFMNTKYSIWLEKLRPYTPVRSLSDFPVESQKNSAQLSDRFGADFSACTFASL